MEEKATQKQIKFAIAIAKELNIDGFDIKNYDTKAKCFKFIHDNIDKFHKAKSAKANQEHVEEKKDVDELPF